MRKGSRVKNQVALNLATKFLEGLGYKVVPARVTDPFHIVCEMNDKNYAITVCSGKHLILDHWKFNAILFEGYIPAILFISREGKYLFLDPREILPKKIK